MKSRSPSDQLPWDALGEAAVAARAQAYAPYSGFAVGAALLVAQEGAQIISACNVENASYGLTICAERAAVATAVGAGYHRFLALAVASSAVASSAPPCGMCLQTLAEFCSEIPLLLLNARAESEHTFLSALLPRRFDGSHLRAAR